MENLKENRTTPFDLTRYYGSKPLVVVKAIKNADGKVIPAGQLITLNDKSTTGYITLLQRSLNYGINYAAPTYRHVIYKGKVDGLLTMLDVDAEPISYMTDSKITQLTNMTVHKDESLYLATHALPGKIVIQEYVKGTVPDIFTKKFLSPDITKVGAIKAQEIVQKFMKRRDAKSKPFTVGGNPVFSFKIYDRSGTLEDIIIKNYDEQSILGLDTKSKPNFDESAG
jgi:hypothetical protein